MAARPEVGTKRIPKCLVVRITGEKMGDGDENHGAQGCGGNRVQKTSAKNFELHKDPATDKRTNKAKNNVRDATKAASAGDFSREPAGDQAHQKPPDKPMRFDPDAKNSLCEHVRSNHEASSGKKDCIRVFVSGKEHGRTDWWSIRFLQPAASTSLWTNAWSASEK